MEKNPMLNDTYFNAKSNLYECDQCDRTFARKYGMVCHLKEHFHGLVKVDPFRSCYNKATNRYDCDKCSKTFYRRCDISKHMHVHHELKNSKTVEELNKDPFKQYWNKQQCRYVCDLCTHCFNYATALKKHLDIHKNPEIAKRNKKKIKINPNDKYFNKEKGFFECGKCAKPFETRSSMNFHFVMHERNAETKQKLDVDPADKYWNNVTDKYHCDQCDKTFSTTDNMQIHVKIHSNQEISEKDGPLGSYWNKMIGQLKKHSEGSSKKLNQEKDAKYMKYWDDQHARYQCDQCDNTYKSVQPLTSHLQVHSLSKRHIKPRRSQEPTQDHYLFSYWQPASLLFQCDQCDKTCDSRRQMVFHLRFHAQVDIISNRDGLNAYWNDDTERFECDKCSDTFEKRSEIKCHVNQHVRCAELEKEAIKSLKLQDAVDAQMETDVEDVATTTETDLQRLWNATLNVFECSECDQTIGRLTGMRRHLLGHAQIQRDVEAFWERIKKGHGQGGRLVEDPMRYMHLSKYWNHVLNRYECDRCEKTYTSRKPMAKHLSLHENDSNPIQVKLPPFVRRSGRKKVVKRKADESTDSDDSDDDSSTTIESNYSEHDDDDEATTAANQLVTFFLNCPQCDRAFNDLSDLQLHVDEVHSNIVDLVCQLCMVSFNNPDLLNGHMEEFHGSAIQVGSVREIESDETTIIPSAPTIYVRQDDFQAFQLAYLIENNQMELSADSA